MEDLIEQGGRAVIAGAVEVEQGGKQGEDERERDLARSVSELKWLAHLTHQVQQ